VAKEPVLIGTWADAVWAIRFYEKHGFQMVGAQEKDRLLRQYWSVPERQMETSAILADPAWRKLNHDITHSASGTSAAHHHGGTVRLAGWPTARNAIWAIGWTPATEVKSALWPFRNWLLRSRRGKDSYIHAPGA
jgi:hypothetical protein